MIDAILVIGKPGSGKSIMIWYLSSLLIEDGFRIRYLSDRLELEKAVMKDTVGVKPSHDGVKIGKHSKLIADGPPGHMKVHVLDGVILNAVHKNYVQTVRKTKNSNAVLLIEYAVGPRIDFGNGKEPLLQDCHTFVDLVRTNGVKEKLFVIDIDVPLAIREQREATRPDAMALETFRSYFPDGGEMTKTDTEYLRGNYVRFNNLDEDHSGYYSEVRYMYETMIRPRLAHPVQRETLVLKHRYRAG